MVPQKTPGFTCGPRGVPHGARVLATTGSLSLCSPREGGTVARTQSCACGGSLSSLSPALHTRPHAAHLAGEDRLRPRAERLVDVELALERPHDVARVLGEAVNVVERRHDEALRLREHRHEPM